MKLKSRTLKEILKSELPLDSFRGILLDFVPIGLDGKTWPKGTNEDSVGNLEHSLDSVIGYINLHSVDRIDVIKIMNRGTIRLRIGMFYKHSLLQKIRNIHIDGIK